jgi:hypothetical protein
MTSDRLNWFLTVAANVGVVLGLGFLAIEVRHNTLATQATLHLDLVSYGRDNAEILVSDPELAAIVFRGEHDPTSLSPLERERFLLFTTWRITIWETAFLNHDAGLVSDRYWIGFDGWYSELVRSRPGYRYWWKESRHGFEPSFQNHVKRILASQSEDAV